MNRREFINNLAIAGMFSILPSAVTYERIWKKTDYIYYIDAYNLQYPGYSHSLIVYALDLKNGIGFTPQDRNPTWKPDKNYKKVSMVEFNKLVAKNLKCFSTHFWTKQYYDEISGRMYRKGN